MGQETRDNFEGPTAMIKHVYLFDIDGTLIDAAGVGSVAFRETVRTILGLEVTWQGRDFAGQTDAGLFRRAMNEAKRSGDETRRPFFADYHNRLEQNLRVRPAEILPGVETLLARLAADPANRVALLTGNTQRGSELKLAGLFSQFGFGIFGEHHADRSDLGREARRYAEATFGAGVALTVIGDTPNDIACARAAGAEAVAVGTGHFSLADLAHADRVLSDLTHWL